MQKLNKKTINYLTIIIIFFIGIYYFFIKEDDYLETNTDFNVVITENTEENQEIEENLESNITEDNKKENDIKNKIVIYITGAVKNQGVYELEENSRIADAIKISGGLTEDANINDINLAYILEDGMKIYIPKKSDNINDIKDYTNIYVSKENNTSSNSNNANSENKSSKVNINTATQAELESLPGIGPSTATKIINYRKENGKFSSIEDIKNVSGIGDSKYNQIKEFIEI